MRALVVPLPGVLPAVSVARASRALERAQGTRDLGAPSRARDRPSSAGAAAAERGGSGSARGPEPCPPARSLVSFLGQPKDAPALASSTRRQPRTYGKSLPGAAAARWRAPSADRPARAREPALGISADLGELRKLGLRASATSVRSLLKPNGIPPAPRRASFRAGVPARSGGQHDRIRFLHRRHRAPQAALRLVLHRAPLPPRPPCQLHLEPERELVTQQARNLTIDLPDGKRPLRFLVSGPRTRAGRARAGAARR
jgi:hypothetical protein